MAEKVKIVELDFDIEALMTNTQEAYKAVDTLNEKQQAFTSTMKLLKKEMSDYKGALEAAKKAGDTKAVEELTLKLDELDKQYTENSKAMIVNKTELASARKEYAAGEKAVGAYVQAEQKQLNIINQTNGSIDQLSAAITNNVNAYKQLSEEQQNDTETGGKLLKLIKEQREAYKQKQLALGNTSVNVGDYEESIKRAVKALMDDARQEKENIKMLELAAKAEGASTEEKKKAKLALIEHKEALKQIDSELKVYGQTVDDASSSSVDMTGGMDMMTKGAASSAKGMWGMVKSALAFIATPLGAVLTAIAATVAVLVKAFSRSESSMAKLKTITGSLSGAFGGFMNMLKPAVEFIANGAVKAFEKLGVFAEKTMGVVSKGLKALGFDKAADNVDKFTEKIKENAKAGGELAKMEAEQVVRERELETIQKQYLKEQEKFRQIRDDVSKSTAERIKANDNLGASLLKQSAIEMSIFQQAKKIAEENIKVNGETSENLDKLAAAKANIADLEERINGFQSEQLVNAVGLRKEAADAAKAQSDEAKAKAKEAADLAKEQMAKAVEVAQNEVDIWIEANKSKLKNDEDYNNQSVGEEQKRLTTIYEKQSAILEEQRKQGIVSESEYNLQKLQLQNAYIEEVFAIDEAYQNVVDNRNAAQLEKEQSDYEAKLELRTLRGENEFSLQAEQLDREYNQQIEAAQKLGEDTTTLTAIYDEKKKKLDEDVLKAQLDGTESTLSGIAELLGENTAAGKAAAIASTAISTYKSATEAYSAMVGIPVVGPVLAPIAAGVAVAAGLANVRKIAATDTTVKAERGLSFTIGGNRHSAGGTKFYGEDGTRFEAEQGETMFILNRMASARLAPSLSMLNQSTGGVPLFQNSSYLAAGGQVSRPTVISNNISDPINYDLLAQKIGEANRQLPAPVVGVKDIISKTDNYAQIVSGANL